MELSRTSYLELEWDKLLGISGTNYLELEWDKLLGIRVGQTTWNLNGTNYLELSLIHI